MAYFSTLTQAATCVCLGRGYVIEAGDFTACTCEAGEAFAVELAAIRACQAPELAPAIAPAAPVQAPELAPIVAGPARTVAPTVVRRASAHVPGLSLERRGLVLAFTYGAARIAYDVTSGALRVVELKDGGYLLPREREHIRATAEAYARKVAA